MKKPYIKPVFAVEKFALTQQIAACSALKINMQTSSCVLDNTDMADMAIPGYFDMVTLAADGYFWECIKKPAQDHDSDLLCYYTSVNMAFVS